MSTNSTITTDTFEVTGTLATNPRKCSQERSILSVIDEATNHESSLIGNALLISKLLNVVLNHHRDDFEPLSEEALSKFREVARGTQQWLLTEQLSLINARNHKGPVELVVDGVDIIRTFTDEIGALREELEIERKKHNETGAIAEAACKAIKRETLDEDLVKAIRLAESIRTSHNGVMSMSLYLGHDGHNACFLNLADPRVPESEAGGESGRTLLEAVERAHSDWRFKKLTNGSTWSEQTIEDAAIVAAEESFQTINEIFVNKSPKDDTFSAAGFACALNHDAYAPISADQATEILSRHPRFVEINGADENSIRWMMLPNGLRRNHPAYQQRVLDEKAELDKKAHALSQFIGLSPVFVTLDVAEQERLKEQNDIMWQYSEILGKRIAGFGSLRAES